MASFYSCEHNFIVCVDCCLDHFIRHKIVSHTSQQSKYERYVMKAVKDGEGDDEAEIDIG